ncbi:MAG: V-type H(+)-translocating pyrophosphatase [Bacteroidota bacterium]|nr:V-type H(+)-translocating pyrophosphatase [Candidatus Kapabacteria bacterium]MCS7302252.1 V-type H(+)-translocating pyrophosphatase [Candidatus Kapabacteria bacterium]MCX7937331.1 V-type H(+)-translocating pyrophosphatase [Chlorobiota bacterium]MDW8271511.1 V-type H(+)-translocating pyrophosphatase [Bacteroidota bacterium]
MVIAAIIACGVFAVLIAVFFTRSIRAIPIAEGAASPEEAQRVEEVTAAIAEGAMAFIAREYRTLGLFMLVFGFLIWMAVDNGFFTMLSFFIGAGCSMLAGYIGMRIATIGNGRAAAGARISLQRAFSIAFRSGAVMGFGLTGIAILGLIGVYIGLDALLPTIERHVLMEILSGFALGGSSVALFGRVGGGIYTKAADVGADLVGKVEAGIPEDDPRNPAVIADNVGDNVGDIAGMGADLFGSVAESTCAALVIGASAFRVVPSHMQEGALLFPILVNALGVLGSFVALFFARPKSEEHIENALKTVLIVATIIMAIVLYPITVALLPPTFTLEGSTRLYTNTGVYWSLLVGLLSGMLVGIVTEYYTAHRYRTVRAVAESSQTGAATNIIYGLALGYNSAVVPMLLLALTVVVGISFAGMYGIAIGALGMLSTIAIGLTIDAYGPVSDNAGGIAEMSHMGKEIRSRTDALDAAGNTTAAIGKGFAIGSAALTSLALTSAFLTRAKISPEQIGLTTPPVLAGLLIGGALPFAFSALTMRAVGKAAFDMIAEVRRQFREIQGLLEGKARADYRRCVDISTQASLRQMVAPGLLVILTPLVVGFLFGVHTLAGVLIGALVCGVMLATSMANAGAAWDNAKKYIEKGNYGGKGSDAHKAAVVGDTVGDPFKDTAGPSLNILIKLMAIISLVFVPFFVKYGGVLLK